MRKDLFPKISAISKAGFLSLNMMHINAMNAKKEKKFLKKYENKIEENNFFNKINNKRHFKKSDRNSIKTNDGDFESYFKISNDDILNLKIEIQNKLGIDKELRNSLSKLDKNKKYYKQDRENIRIQIKQNNKSLVEFINKYIQELKRIDIYGTNKPKDIKGYRDFLEEIVKKLIEINSVGDLLDINSKYIIETILDFLPEKRKLELIKYNKEIQERIGINRTEEYFKYNFKITINYDDYDSIINVKNINLGENFNIEKTDNGTVILSNKNDITRDFKFKILNDSLNILKDAKNLEVKIESPYNTFRSCEEMFYAHDNITKIDISNFYTGNVVNFSTMFAHCINLKEIVGLNNMNTEKAVDMSSMFAYCKKLKEIDLSNFNTSNVNKMLGMFRHCKNLKEVIGFSDLKVEKVNNISYLFSECKFIEKIKFPEFKNVKNMSSLFYHCTCLSEVDFNGMDFSTLELCGADSMFTNCERLKKILNYSENQNLTTYFSLSAVFGYINSARAEKDFKDFINIFNWES